MTHMLLHAPQEAFGPDKTREEEFANSFLACAAPTSNSSSSISTSSSAMKFDFGLPQSTSAALASMFDFAASSSLAAPPTSGIWTILPPVSSMHQMPFESLPTTAFDAVTAATMATPFGNPTDVSFEDEIGDIKMLQEALMFEPAYSPMSTDELVHLDVTPRHLSAIKDIKEIDEQELYEAEMELIDAPSSEDFTSEESEAETVAASSSDESNYTPSASPVKMKTEAPAPAPAPAPVVAPIMPSVPVSVIVKQEVSTSTPAMRRKPNARICRVENCTRGIRSRGLCKAHGGGRRCQTPGCKISDQGGGHCIAHGGGKRCSFIGCQKSAQSRGLCKLHGGGRKCKEPSCIKKSQHRGYCRAHAQMANLIPTKPATASQTSEHEN